MQAEPGSVNATRPRVLVVDDSRVIRKAVSKILGSEFEVLEAEDGEHGWNSLTGMNGVDVLISDIQMPVLDGYALICRIRAADERRIRDLPIIVITGAQDDQTKERAFACGATDFIIKPIDGPQLLARTRAHARLDQTGSTSAEATAAPDREPAIDPLTKLNSRRYLVQRGTQDLAYARRHNTEITVVRLALDNFKELSERFDENTCKHMIVWLAQIVIATVRVEDTAARIADGEFAIVAPSAGRMDGALLCERLRTAVTADPFIHEGSPVPLTISLGFANLGRDPGDSIEDLLVTAEQRLTLAKAAGGNRLGAIYQDEIPGPEEAVMEQPDMETALAMLAEGDGGKLLPYLPDMLAQITPLLEFCDKNMDLGLTWDLEALKARLAELK